MQYMNNQTTHISVNEVAEALSVRLTDREKSSPTWSTKVVDSDCTNNLATLINFTNILAKHSQKTTTANPQLKQNPRVIIGDQRKQRITKPPKRAKSLLPPKNPREQISQKT